MTCVYVTGRFGAFGATGRVGRIGVTGDILGIIELCSLLRGVKYP